MSPSCSWEAEPASNEQKVLVERIIAKLVGLKEERPGRNASLEEDEIVGVLRAAGAVLSGEPALLEVEAPVKVCGDIHGQYYDLLRVFEMGGYPPKERYLFLGDYIDRGRHGIETMVLLLTLKIQAPEQVWLLRGNHETQTISRNYGFYHECSHLQM